MMRIIEYIANIGLFFASLNLIAFIYYKFRMAIRIKRYPDHKEEIKQEPYYKHISETAGKVYVAALTASLFCFIFTNPVFQSLIGISNEEWGALMLIFLIFGVSAYSFSIISIILYNTHNNSNEK